MAKRKSSRARRGFPTTANQRLSRSRTNSSVAKKITLSPLRLYGDLRQFHPAPFIRPAPHFRRAATRLVVGNKARSKKTTSKLPTTVKFANPQKVLVCVRRKARKEVLLAIGKGGSQKNRRKPKRNQWSDVSCRHG